MDFKIETLLVAGIEISMKASGNSMRTKIDHSPLTESDVKRAVALAYTPIGSGEDNYLNGCVVWFDIYAPLYQWKEIQRYGHLDFVSSCSTMHCIVNKNPNRQFNVEECCNDYVSKVTINEVNKFVELYNATYDEDKRKEYFNYIISNLPSGFILGATMITNYRQLRTVYNQRKGHKLIEWRWFNNWIESLPHSELITGKRDV